MYVVEYSWFISNDAEGRKKMTKVTTIDANEFDSCDLCGRNHRKLVMYRGHKLGKNCKDHLDYFFRGGNTDNNKIAENIKALTGLIKSDIIERNTGARS